MSAKSALALTPIYTAEKLASSPVWISPACIIATDLIALSLIYWLAVMGRFRVEPDYDLSLYIRLFPCILLFSGSFFMQGLYPGFLLHPAEEMRRVFYSASVIFLLFASATFFWHSAGAYSRSVIIVTWAVSAPTVLLFRCILRNLCAQRAWWGVPAVVLGSGVTARRVIRSLKNTKLGIKITGVVTDDDTLTWPDELPPILGPLNLAPAIARLGSVQYAIVAMPDKISNELKHAIQDYCQGFRHVLWVPDLPGVCSMGFASREIGSEVGFEVPQRLFHPSNALAKRTLDLAASVVALLILSPLFLAIALAVTLTSPGPALFRHARFGRNGSTFKALKFRTMVTNGDQILAAYLESNPQNEQEWLRDQKLKHDPRITSVGRWLRRYSLDELPQLLNVLLGKMSLVGPRPIYAATEIAQFGRAFELYKRVPPGITGLWQVSGRNNTTYQERVAFDEYYVHNWSIWMDAYILIRTIRVVLTGEGAY